MRKAYVFLYTLRRWHNVRKSIADVVVELEDLEGARASEKMAELSDPDF